MPLLGGPERNLKAQNTNEKKENVESIGVIPDGEFHYMIRGTADVTDSKHNSLFTFVSIVTEKLETRKKFQRRGKSYL